MSANIKCANCGTGVTLRDLNSSNSLLLQPTPPVDLFKHSISESKAVGLYSLGIYQCPSCSLIQIIKSPPANLFYDNYIYTSSSSPDMRLNFLNLKESILAEIDLAKPQIKILDIGCNDGLLLSMFKDQTKFRLYGTDPSPVAKQAAENTFILHSEYFPGAATKEAAPYDLIIGTNSLAHIPNIGACFSAIKNILSPDGIVVIEVSDFNQMVMKGAWDYIYHEHLYYYTKSSLVSILAARGLEVFRIDDIATKGGSLRVFARHLEGEPSPAFIDQTTIVSPIPTLKAKYEDCIKNYAELADRIPEDATLYGYGACATGSVAMSQHPVFRRLSLLIDDNINRQYLYSPHWATQVIPLRNVSFKPNDIVVIFAWRFIETITRNIHDHCNTNKLPVPEIVGSIKHA